LFLCPAQLCAGLLEIKTSHLDIPTPIVPITVAYDRLLIITI
jgi:hypothetical protein